MEKIITSKMNFSKILIVLSLLICLSCFANSMSFPSSLPARLRNHKVKVSLSPSESKESEMVERGITEWRFKREIDNSIENSDDSAETFSTKVFVSCFS